MAKPVKDMHVCIAGSGMGGLATALTLARQGFTKIDVFETAKDLGFVGAGIQLAPNMARILDNLGVWDKIAAEATDIKATSIRQGATNEELAHVDLTYIRKEYSHPHMVGHRASLAGEMYEGCKSESKSITFHFSTSIEGVKSFSPKPILIVKPRHGEEYTVECDVLLAADGVKSNVRDQMMEELGVAAKIVDTNSAAYRIMLTREQMAHDPELLELIDADRVTRWIGEKRHIIAYPVSNKTIYNLSSSQPDTNFADAPSATYTTRGSKSAMQAVFADYCPLVHRMLDLVPDGEVCEWKLRVHEPLPTWVHGCTALVGDACHPTLPHMNQGAAQAIEDGAVLGVVLGKLPDASPASINKALRIYEGVRKERAETLVELAAANGRAMQLGKKESEERDKQFAALRLSGGRGTVPDKWADADIQKMIYGFDAMAIAAEQFDEKFTKM